MDALLGVQANSMENISAPKSSSARNQIHSLFPVENITSSPGFFNASTTKMVHRANMITVGVFKTGS